MADYKGYTITVTTAQYPGGRVTDAIYSVRRGGQVVHDGVTRGAFDTPEAAQKAATAAAGQWIDQQGS